MRFLAIESHKHLYSQMTFDDQSRRHAISRLSRKKAYRHQVINYLWVNALLIVVWALTGFGSFWPIYPIF